jgi:polyphosphate kinase 2 (PPK2 family)
MGHLDELDLSQKLSREEEARRLAEAQEHLLALRLVLGGLVGERGIGPPVCVVFEGWDASGKGGAIRRLVERLDPRHVRVVQYAAPTYDEKRHHWLSRFWPALPGWGGMAVLDRSWYGRVLVERVEGFAAEEQWQRAYGEINDFEKTLADEGAILIKFWLHISSKEQLKRFEAREREPLKRWKLTDEDWRNRKKRKAYKRAIEDMVERTSTAWAPWSLVEAESKRFARVKVVETVNAANRRGHAPARDRPAARAARQRLAVADRLLARRALSAALGARLGLGLALVLVRALVAQAVAQLLLGNVGARVAHDHRGDHREQQHQAAADEEQRRPADAALVHLCVRVVRRRGRRDGRFGRGKRPERVVLRERRRREGERDDQGEEAHQASHGSPKVAMRARRSRPSGCRRSARRT